MEFLQREDKNVTERRPFVGLLGKGKDLVEILYRDVVCQKSKNYRGLQ